MVPPASHRVSRVPWYSGSYLKSSRLNYVAFTLYSGAFQLSSSTIGDFVNDVSSTPVKKTSLVWANPLSLGPVWPLPRSLATTGGISLDFSSSGYLDVSVPRVPLVKLCIHLTILRHYSK